MYTKKLKGAYSDPVGFFFKVIAILVSYKNCYIFLIIILKFHTIIPCRSGEIIKNVPILLIMVVTTINNYNRPLLEFTAVYFSVS